MVAGKLPLRIIDYCIKKAPLFVPVLKRLHQFRFIFQQWIKCGCKAVPARHVVTDLRPAKHPWDRSKIVKLKAIGPAAGYRPRRNRKVAYMFNRSNFFKPSPEVVMVNEIAISGHRTIRNLIHNLFGAVSLLKGFLSFAGCNTGYGIYNLLQMPLCYFRE